MIGCGQRLVRDCHSHCIVPLVSCLLVPALHRHVSVDATTSPLRPKGACRRRQSYCCTAREICASDSGRIGEGVICPTGKKTVASENLSSPARENIPLRVCPKSNLQFPPPRTREEGRLAIVTEVGSGMRWTRRVIRRMTRSRTAKSCGSGAPTLALSFANDLRE